MYSRAQTAHTAVIRLSNFMQVTDESVNNFGECITKVIDDLHKLTTDVARQPQEVN